MTGASVPQQSDGEERPFYERDAARVVAFSDGVIAIAITLLVLEIRPPQDTARLARGLAALWPSYLAYAITFLLIGQIWANHHVMFDHIRHADRVVLALNTILLMDIAFLPFTASVLASSLRDGRGERTAVLLQGAAFELAALLFNAIWWYARQRRRLVTQTLTAPHASAISRRFALAPVWLAVATLMGVVVPVAGVVLITAFVAYYWLPIPGESATDHGA